jgi:protein-disulfide isomerase
MSNKRERERRRQERHAAEGAAGAAARRTKLFQLAAGAVFLAIAAVLVLIAVNSTGNGSGGDTKLEHVSEAQRLLRGLPQRETVLGDPKAPVKLYEYGDLQCPVCAGFAKEILPPIIGKQVKNGAASITFRNFVVLGDESVPAGTAMLAAGEQDRAWNFLEIFYRNQGEERSGYVTDEFIEAVGKAAGISDLGKWNEARKAKGLEEAVTATTEEAQRLGFNATPSFAIEGPRTQGLEALGFPGSTGDLEAAIEAAG